MQSVMEEAVAEAGEISGEPCFCATIKIVALPAPFAGDGADTDDGPFAPADIIVGDDIENGDCTDIVHFEDILAFFPVGFRPTFNGTDLRLEVHIFDFHEDIYEQELTVYFVDYIRSNLKFDNVDALIVQMNRDSEQAREILATL